MKGSKAIERGRPPKYLHVNAESAYVLAIDLGVKESILPVSDFNGRILDAKIVLRRAIPRRTSTNIEAWRALTSSRRPVTIVSANAAAGSRRFSHVNCSFNSPLRI